MKPKIPLLIDEINTSKKSIDGHIKIDIAHESIETQSYKQSFTITDNPLVNGLITYYPIEKGAGTVLTDATTNKNDGKIIGPNWTDTGQIGSKSIEFDGLDDYIKTPHSSELAGLNELTISVWIKPKAYPKSYDTTFRPIVMKGGIDSNWEYQLTRRSGNGATGDDDQIYFGIDDDVAAIYDSLPISGWNNILEEWHHVTGVFDGNNQTLEVYWDGKSELSKDISITAIPSRTGDLSIAWDQVTSEDRYNPAELEDIRIYNRAISSSEVDSIYNLTSPSGFQITGSQVPNDNDGGISNYKLNGDVTDSWSNNDGTDNTSAGFTDGVYGRAKQFDGSNDYIDIPNSFGIFDGSQDFTVSTWVKLLDDTEFVWFFSARAEHGVRFGFDSGKPIFQIISNGTPYDAIGSSVNTGDWIHLTGVFKSGNYSELYVNGQNVDSNSHGKNSIKSYSLDNSIGVDKNGNEKYYHGDVDDLRIYDKALTETEVEKLFSLGSYKL